jgi:hypothetical protein
MTTPALRLHGFLFNHRMALRPMRVVAARTSNLPFNNGVMGRLVYLHSGLLMAADTGFVFELTLASRNYSRS